MPSRRALLALATLAALAACGDPGSRATQAERGHDQPVVLFVLFDALRPDRLGVSGNPRPTSPSLDRLAGQGLFFSNLIVHAPQTVPSTLSILSSRLPYEHGLQYDPATKSFPGASAPVAPRVPDGLPLLAEVLADAGYSTAAVVANPWLKAEYGFGRGYGEYVEVESRDGAVVNREARRLLSEHRGEKLFLYLHYMDVHNPYTGPLRGPAPFPRPARGEYVYSNGLVPGLSQEDLEYTRALYDERIVYADGHLAELLDFARDVGDLTLVVTSDHGDEFFEHGGLGHGTTLYDELIHSFAVIWSPQRLAPLRIDRPVPAIDLAPTLLDVLGVAAPASWRGHPARRAAEPGERAIFSELANRKAVMRGRWKLQVDVESGREELYDMAAGAELESRQEPDVRAALRTLLEPLLSPSGTQSRDAAPLDPETARRLRELGYLDAPEPDAP